MKQPISTKISKSIYKTLHSVQSWGLSFTKSYTKPCILCYHSISDDDSLFSLSPEEFERQISCLAKTRRVLPLSDLIRRLDDGLKDELAITFDDGYENVYDQALPILKKYGFRATVFVLDTESVTGNIETGINQKFLPISKIKELKKEGWEIGFHSRTHKDLDKLNPRQLFCEVVEGKLDMEKKLGFKLNYFSYPQGRYSKKIVDLLQMAGFSAGFTVDGGSIKKGEHLYRINRVIVSRHHDFQNFQTLLTDIGLVFNSLLEKVLRIKDGKTRAFDYLKI